MKILVLTKRFYTGKDLLQDEYGRCYEIPKHLERLGHDVTGVCLSYYRDDSHEVGPLRRDGPPWYTYCLWSWGRRSILRWRRDLLTMARQSRPDVVIAGSDAFHVIAGHRLAVALDLPLVVDLYDNFESFQLTKLPGIRNRFRRSVQAAQGVIFVGEQLKDRVVEDYSLKAPVTVVCNGIPPGLFRPIDQAESRRKFELPQEARIIGFSGAISAARGVSTVLKAFGQMAQSDTNLLFALAGRIDKGMTLQSHERLRYIGQLPYDQVPEFINCLDVGLVSNLNSEFGRYSFPMKTFEYLACGVPIVAANVGETATLFRDHTEVLYEPENTNSLIGALRRQLTQPTAVRVVPVTWPDLTRKVDEFLQSTLMGCNVTETSL